MGGGGGGGGQEDVFGPGYVFHLPNNKKHIVEFSLSWIFFSGKLGPGNVFRKIFLPSPTNKRTVHRKG